jgi:GTP cyclohydrolase II
MHSNSLAPQAHSLEMPRPVQTPRASLRCTVPMPLANGATPTMTTFSALADKRDDHFALQFATHEAAEAALVRIHSSCATGDILGSIRCDCGSQLKEAIDLFTRNGGIIIYLNQEGRGIGLASKLDAYAMQDDGLDTFTANRALGFRDDERDYIVAAQILDVLIQGRPIRLLTNNPEKAVALERYGICVQECIPTCIYESTANRRYLEAKRDAGHRITLKPLSVTSQMEF